MIKNYKVIFIDWNGTLSQSRFWSHLEITKPQLFKKIEYTLFVNNKHLLKPWMRGDYKTEEILNFISTDCNISYDFLLQELIKSCMNMTISLKVIKLIKELRMRGKKVVIASDNMDTFIRWTIPSLKLQKIFDSILDSYSLKAAKRDVNDKGESLFFKKYLISNNINPGESIILDDSEDKQNLIKNFGIDYFQISTKKGLTDILEQIKTFT